MFKDLKSKLEDEAKRLQATVSQYSENIAQQVRSGVSDSGSDAGGRVRKLFGNNKNEKTTSNSDQMENEVAGAGLDANSSALMQEISESDIFGVRERRLSEGSVGSNEGSLSSIFSSIPGVLNSGQRLSTIASDVESESFSGSTQLQSASKEQISVVLHKLQGRAASYKDKYKGLAKIYNEIVKENEKYRAVLTATQDKALERVEQLRKRNRQYKSKIQELEDVVESIKVRQDQQSESKEHENEIKQLQISLQESHLQLEEQKNEIQRLTDQNKNLKENIDAVSDEQGISDLAVQRVTAEWKGRIDCIEEEWSKRLRDAEEMASLAIAKVKAEMHAAFEEKESELQAARAKCKNLESQGSDVLQQIDELKATVDALESEKADMVEKLSKAKLQGVLAVRNEEEEKRNNLIKDMELKHAEDKEADEQRYKKEIKKIEDEWKSKLKEQEEQAQLAIEEREMQKVAAVMEHDRKNDDLGAQVEELLVEKLHLKSVLEDFKEKHRLQMDELCSSIETNKERYSKELALANERHNLELEELKKDFQNAVELNKQLRISLKAIEDRNKQEIRKFNDTDELSTKLEKANSIEVLNGMKIELNNLREAYQALKFGEGTLGSAEHNVNLTAKDYEKRLEELSKVVDEKMVTIRNLESDKEFLATELTSRKEYSHLYELYEHLQDQLNLVRSEQELAEKQCIHMEKRAEKASVKLQEDKRILSDAKIELEKNVEERQQAEANQVVELKTKLNQSEEEMENLRQELEGKVALLIAETDALRLENEQYKIKLENWQDTQRSRKSSENKGETKQTLLKPEIKNHTEEMLINIGLDETMNQSVQTSALANVDINSSKSVLSVDTQTEAEGSENESNSYKVQNTSLLSQISTLEQQLSSKMDEIKRLTEIIVTNERDREELQSQVTSLISQMNAMEKVQDGLVRDVALADGDRNESLLLREEIENKVEEIAAMRASVASAENSLNEKTSKLNDFQNKIAQMEAVNEKLRAEFLQKESIVSELQIKIDRQTNEEGKRNSEFSELKESLQKELERRATIENDLKDAHENERYMRSIENSFKELLSRLGIDTESMDHDKIKSREHFETALELVAKKLKALDNQLLEFEVVRAERDRLSTDLQSQKDECNKVIQDFERRIEEMKIKGQQKIAKIQKQCETDIHTAKAELLLQLSGRDQKIENYEERIAEFERNSSEEQKNIKLIDKLHDDYEKLATQRDKLLKDHELIHLQLNEVKQSLSDTVKEKEELLKQIVDMKKSAEDLRNENERMRTKSEAERQRLIRDLQKEIKQLYHDLNERTQQLDKANAALEESQRNCVESSQKNEVSETKTDNGKRRRSDCEMYGSADYEELCNMRELVATYQKELAMTKEANKKEIAFLNPKISDGTYYPATVVPFKEQHEKTSIVKLDSVDSINFAEPTEAEYLRNVLYRYMNERETLGKESVTLARVIATVVRFTPEQIHAVVSKEEQRNHGWYGGTVNTVQGLISSAQNLSHH